MDAPAPDKKAVAAKVWPIVGGFILLSTIAAYDGRLAMGLAVAFIAFAALSMLVAIFRK